MRMVPLRIVGMSAATQTSLGLRTAVQTIVPVAATKELYSEIV
jgi:hypothetical protein